MIELQPQEQVQEQPQPQVTDTEQAQEGKESKFMKLSDFCKMSGLTKYQVKAGIKSGKYKGSMLQMEYPNGSKQLFWGVEVE